MICLRKIFNFCFLLSFLGVMGCQNYESLSLNERVVYYKFFNKEQKSFVEKYDDKTNQWFRAKCLDVKIQTYSKCANNFQFTNLSISQIENLLSSDNNNETNQLNNQVTNSNNDNENDSYEDEDDGEDDWDEEDEEDEEGDLEQ